MGHSTPASAADPSTEETSTSTCGSGDTREAQPELDTCEPENTFSTTTNSKTNSDNSSSDGSSSNSESSNDESGDEQSDATTTEPLVDLHINNGGASCTQGTLNPTVSSGDLHLVQALKQERCLTDREKHFLLERSFVPSLGYSFPSRTISGSVRQFQHRWLTSYNNLVYSESANGGFCKFCVLFPKCTPTMKELGIFVTKPFTNFKKALEKLDEHFHGKKFHKIAVEAAMTFMQIQNRRMLSIDQQLSMQRRTTVAQNRLRLRSIVETIIFCG